MPYGVIMDVQAPIEMYDRVHAELARRSDGTSVDGFLLHVARPTDGGYQILEVWESKDTMERYYQFLGQVVAELFGGEQPPSVGQPVTTEFEVRGLVIPRGDILI
jgi:hypothetical protein